LLGLPERGEWWYRWCWARWRHRGHLVSSADRHQLHRFGGGLSVLAGSSASIDASLIVLNAALGGVTGTGGASGQGIGGSLYIGTTADVTLSTSSEVMFNFASTSDDNIFGTYTTS
jgi:hypothetical protein